MVPAAMAPLLHVQTDFSHSFFVWVRKSGAKSNTERMWPTDSGKKISRKIRVPFHALERMDCFIDITVIARVGCICR